MSIEARLELVARDASREERRRGERTRPPPPPLTRPRRPSPPLRRFPQEPERRAVGVLARRAFPRAPRQSGPLFRLVIRAASPPAPALDAATEDSYPRPCKGGA